MKKRANGHKKHGHRALSLLLAVVLLIAFALPAVQVVTADTPNVEIVQFDSAADAGKFDLYSTNDGGFAVANGQLAPTGNAGEFKAIYKRQEQKLKAVSVELHPVGTDGPIFGGLYINASNAANAQDQIQSIYIGIESNFTGWSDALNRIDLVVGQFPAWAELQRTISETGAGNNLFSGGKKEPITLRAEFDGNKVTMTVSLVSNPDKKLTATYYAAEGVDLSLGDVGIRSHHNNACYDNFTVEYDGEEKTVITETVDFAEALAADGFRFFHSSAGGFAVESGKLVPTGESGEFKAVYNKPAGAEVQSVSVELHPGASNTIVGGLYVGAKNPADPVDQIEALYVGLESHFSGWSDAPNRIDLMVGQFPVWAELQRTISETGAGNNLFSGGVKQPLKLTVKIQGNQLLITLSLLSDPSKSISTTYTAAEGVELSLNDVGIRSPFNDAAYDNFTVTMALSEEEPEITDPVPTDLVSFEELADGDKFDFYHSSNGGLQVQDGKLVPTGDSGEFKAIYQDTNAKFNFVSVEIHPGANGFKGGIYFDATDVDHPVDQIDAFAVIAEGNHTGWEDAPNRTDLVVAGFPVWTEYQRVITETGKGNALFAGGVREPVKMTVKLNGNEITVTLCLLSNPKKSVSTVYTFADAEELGLGNVGIYSGFSDCSFDNFAVGYEAVEADKEPDEEILVPTEIVDFENAESGDKFDFYHSSNGGLQVQDGKLVPTGDSGEFKAIFQDTNAKFSFVSVEIHPGANGFKGGVYIDVTDVNHPVDQIDAFAVIAEGNHSGWADAPNRTDLVVASFPVWTEYHRVITETGKGNALFAGGVREPVKMTVKINGNEITVTLCLLSNPKKSVSTVYTFADVEELGLGNVGIYSGFSDCSFDNFAVGYETVEADKEPDQEILVPTEIVDFESEESSDKFDFYHSSKGGLQVQDGKLVPTGDSGEFKAIYKDTNAKFNFVSVEIHPGTNGFKGGIYFDVTDVGHSVDQIHAFAAIAEGNHTGWEDAPNRTDLVVAGFPVWTEYQRVISETGAGNALFAGGVREPVKMMVKINGNEITVTVCLLSNPKKSVSTVYTFADAEELALGNVGIYSGFSDCSFDNFAVGYETVEADKEPDEVIPEKEPTEIVDFESAESSTKFDFYHSSNGGLQVQDGKLVPTGEAGEFKAIYRDGGSTIQSVSVDIYPGESGQINSGLYIGTSTVEDGVDLIKGLAIMVESNHSGWEDAVNRIDLVVGRFPVWRELHRYISETGNGNALFAGQKEPLRLKVDINGKEIIVRLSLISDPSRYVETAFEFTGATNLAAHNVGLRSAFNDVSFDDFKVYSTEGGGSADPTEKDETEDTPDGTGNQGGTTGSTPNSGDSFQPMIPVVLMLISGAAFGALVWTRKRILH